MRGFFKRCWKIIKNFQQIFLKLFFLINSNICYAQQQQQKHQQNTYNLSYLKKKITQIIKFEIAFFNLVNYLKLIYLIKKGIIIFY